MHLNFVENTESKKWVDKKYTLWCLREASSRDRRRGWERPRQRVMLKNGFLKKVTSNHIGERVSGGRELDAPTITQWHRQAGVVHGRAHGSERTLGVRVVEGLRVICGVWPNVHGACGKRREWGYSGTQGYFGIEFAI